MTGTVTLPPHFVEPMNLFYYQWPPKTVKNGGDRPDQISSILSAGETKGLSTRLRLASTSRRGGVSEPPFDSLNLGRHVDDDPRAVEENRQRLSETCGHDLRFAWLSQVHGTRCVDAAEVVDGDRIVEADASFTTEPGVACVVMTADCLPVVLFDRRGSVVAAAHAGWRGLVDGVLESTVDAMGCDPSQLVAWMGPAIGPEKFEVGPEVREQFLDADPGAERCFAPSPFNPDDRLVADLYELARRRLRRRGVPAIAGGGACTFSDDARFFSYRRDGKTGRMATLCWLAR